MVLDGHRRVFGVRVEPGGIHAALPIGLEGVVVGRALPGAHRGGVAVLQVPVFDRVPGEVVVTFDDHRVLGLGDDDAVPHSFDHG